MLKASRTQRVAPTRVSDLLTQHHPTSSSSAPAIPYHNSKSPTKLCKTPFWSSPGADTASKPTALLGSLPTHLFGLAEDLLHEDEVVAGVSAHQLLQAPAVQAQPGCRGDRATVTHSPVQEHCRRDQQREGVRAKVFATCVRSQWRKKNLMPSFWTDVISPNGAYLSGIASYPSTFVLSLTQPNALG